MTTRLPKKILRAMKNVWSELRGCGCCASDREAQEEAMRQAKKVIREALVQAAEKQRKADAAHLHALSLTDQAAKFNGPEMAVFLIRRLG